MTITEVSEKYNITPDTLRYYEKEGLIPYVNRTNGGVRNYSQEDCTRIGFIKCMRGAGLSIEVLKKYFDLFSKGKRTLKTRRDLLATEREKLKKHLTELEDTIKRLDYKISVYDKALKSKSKELKF